MCTEELERLSDEDLYRGLAECDRPEFEARYAILFDRLHQRLVHAASLRLNEHEDAEDVACDTWACLLSPRCTYNPDRSKLYTWMYRVMRNKSVDLVRRRMTEHAYAGLLTAECNPDEWTLALGAAAGHFLADMPPRLRHAVLLHCVEGKDYDTVAALSGISPRQARYRANAGMLWLRARVSVILEAARF